MITYDNNADLSRIVLRPTKKIKSFGKSKTETTKQGLKTRKKNNEKNRRIRNNIRSIS